MVKKGTNKKGKKNQNLGFDSDEEPAGLDISLNNETPAAKKSSNNFGFSSLTGLEDLDIDLEGLDEEDGLMSMLNSAPKKGNKKPKKNKTSFADLDLLDEDADLNDDAEEDIEVPTMANKKKDKKSKSKKKQQLDDFDDAFDDMEKLAQGEDLDLEEEVPQPKAKGGKKKKNKKLDDDFDAAFDDSEKLAAGEDLDYEEPVPAPKTKGKKNKKKQQDDDWEAAFADPEADEADEAIPEPEPVKKNDKPQKKGKKNKKQDDDDWEKELDEFNAQHGITTPPETPAEPATTIKSSKQKEKERKERQKKERQEQAKLDAALQAAKTSEETSPALAEEKLDADNDNEEGGEGTGKNKKKKKKKTAAEKAEAAPKKKSGAPIGALRKMLEAQREAEELAKKQAEEEAKRIEEEQKRIEEEERIKEEARLAKKEKEREKREQLRKEGKLLTKAQKEAQRRNQLRLEALAASGVIMPNRSEDNADEAGKPKRVVYGNKKKKGKQDQTSPTQAKEPEPKPEPEPEVKPAEEEADVLDSWEELEEKDIVAPVAAPAESEEDVKDNWDDESEPEPEPEVKPEIKKSAAQESAPTKASAKAPTKKSASVEESDEESEEDSEEDSDEDSEDDSDYSDSDDSDSDEELSAAQQLALKKKQESAERRKKRYDEAMAARSKDDLRSPICCILGHVDTGKTKLLDKIRQTNVQEGEAGGITQQIGATYFPVDAIKSKTAVLKKDNLDSYKLPGLLIIDTPGHESFTNLRSRGSSLCNIAILVIDIMHGLEPQTLESIRLLRDRKAPFIVALNKIDRIYGWKPIPDNGFQDSLAQQAQHVKEEFDTRVKATILALMEQGLNSTLYYENKNFAKYVSLVPTSAITGEGIPDILDLLVHLTQTRMSDKLMYLSELECTVLEVKVIEGLGTTIDVVLSNGVLHEGDKIVLCGLNGPIVTNVRALLTPQPLRELRVKSSYVHHKSVKAALGVKISAPDLEKAIAGSRLMVVGPDDDEEDLKEEVMGDLQGLLNKIDKSGRGVSVQASTLGSLEALLEFLKVSKIPVSAINIGPVFKKDIIRCAAMLERAREFAVMLAFDVKVDKEAEEMANQLGIKVFQADIIYHLFDAFTAHNKEITEQKRADQAPKAVFPCVLKMIPGAIFNKRSPIVMGVDVVEGALRLGTPICIAPFNTETQTREVVFLGNVTGIEQNHKPIEVCKKGQAGGGIAIKVELPPYESARIYGRHFTDKDEIYSKISRASIDVLKESFRNDVSKEEWALIIKLKKILEIN